MPVGLPQTNRSFRRRRTKEHQKVDSKDAKICRSRSDVLQLLNREKQERGGHIGDREKDRTPLLRYRYKTRPQRHDRLPLRRPPRFPPQLKNSFSLSLSLSSLSLSLSRSLSLYLYPFSFLQGLRYWLNTSPHNCNKVLLM